MFHFRFTVTEKDYIEFNEFHALNSPHGKKSFNTWRFFVPIILAAFFAVILISSFTPETLIGAITLWAVVSGVWMLVSKPLYLMLIRNNINKMKKSGKLPYSKNVFFQFNEEYILEVTEESETKTKYSNIVNAVMGKSAVYLYMNVAQGYIIPFTAFESEEQKAALIRFINYKIDKSAEVLQ